MVAKASIIKNYAKADAAGKVDIICKNYSNFIGIVDGYTEGLCYMIENEKAYNRKQGRGDLGVRVQTSGMHIVEIAESMESVIKRFLSQGMPVDEISKRTMYPIDFLKSLINLE